MSNLDSATSAIRSEIEHAKEGVTFYKARIDSLEKLLVELGRVDSASGHASLSVAAPKKRGPKPKSAIQAEGIEQAATRGKSTPAAGKKAARQKGRKSATPSGGDDLPFTGGNYWPDLVTAEPKSASEVLDAAIASLGFTPTKEQVQKMANRMTFALNSLVKSKAISDSGRGRERRFFKA